MYRIGIDGGGTRTRLVVFIDRTEKYRGETGGINYNSFSRSVITDNLTSAVNEMKSAGFAVEDCEGIGIGAAGVSNPNATPFIEGILRDAGFNCPIVIAGDQEAALAGAAGKQPGILLIAGTGSICMAQDGQGHVYRSGGFGHIIDDAGSAYAAGRDILTAVVRAEDGRGRATALKESVYQFLNVHSMEELIAYVYDKTRSKRDIAAVAACLTEELIGQDDVAHSIAKEAASEQVRLVEAVLAQFLTDSVRKTERIPLFLEGGLILKNAEVGRMFRELLEERNVPVYLAEKERDAAYGASLLVK